MPLPAAGQLLSAGQNTNPWPSMVANEKVALVCPPSLSQAYSLLSSTYEVLECLHMMDEFCIVLAL